MKSMIHNLTIEGYRALRHLKINGLGRVNMITGRNNSGKSSLLEALRILASNASPDVLYEIVRFREEDTFQTQDTVQVIGSENVFDFFSLFYGFPADSRQIPAIDIAAAGSHSSMSLSIRLTRMTENRLSEISRGYPPEQQFRFNSEESIPVLVTVTDAIERVRSLETVNRLARNRSAQSVANESRLTCKLVNAYGGEQTGALGSLWDAIALTDREQQVVEALRVVDPHITAVSMVGGNGSTKSRTAVVKSTASPRPVPLRSFGDGMNRVFGIILALVNAKDGWLLIDEFENGMHYSIQYDIWRIIFKLAYKLNVQVFATSHSWDAIEAFQKAAGEMPEEGALVRLLRKSDDVIATVFSEEDLKIVTRDKIEVR